MGKRGVYHGKRGCEGTPRGGEEDVKTPVNFKLQ